MFRHTVISSHCSSVSKVVGFSQIWYKLLKNRIIHRCVRVVHLVISTLEVSSLPLLTSMLQFRNGLFLTTTQMVTRKYYPNWWGFSLSAPTECPLYHFPTWSRITMLKLFQVIWSFHISVYLIIFTPIHLQTLIAGSVALLLVYTCSWFCSYRDTVHFFNASHIHPFYKSIMLNLPLVI